MKRFGEIIKTQEQEFAKEKHMPIIDAPQSARAGEFFEVTVTVGKEVPHPNTLEHHIKWIQVYAEFEGHAPVHVGTFDFGPTFASPTATFKMKLDKPATIYAVEYCNIHGLWEHQVKIGIE